MPFGEAGIDLNRIGILNGCFAELALVAVAVAALDELLFAHIGIAIAADKEGREEEPDEQQTDDNRAAHVFSKAGAKAHTTTNLVASPKVLQDGVVRKVTADTEVEGGLSRFDCLLFQKFLSELSGLAASESFARSASPMSQ